MLALPKRHIPTGIDEAQQSWLAAQPKVPKANPCIRIYGSEPPGKTCGECSHLFVRGDTARTYYKCDLRANTGGPATDHRRRWPSCGKFTEREGLENGGEAVDGG